MADTDTAEIAELDEPRVWKLSPREFALTVEKVAKINARAAKRGFTGRWDLVGVETTVEVQNPLTGLTDTFVVVETTLTGEAPKYDNTRFLARVEWNEGKPIIQAAPGVEGVDRSVLVPGFCGHCNTIRSRKNTYVVERDGVQTQLGSSCIKDYLGWSTTPVLIFDDPISDSDFEDGLGGYYGLGEQSFTPLTILQTAWAAIRCFGFVPARSFDGQPTATLVKYALGVYRLPTGARDRKAIEEDLARLGALVDEAGAEAQRVLDFVLSDDFSGSSEYVENLKTVAAADAVEGRFIGLLASAPQAYAKHLERTLVRKAREERPSEHVGAVKERLTLTVTVENIRYIARYNQFNGQEETTVLYTLRDEETGNVFKWFASREALGDTKGVTVTIKGTVKGHETYNGLKSTVLTRCAVQEA